MHAVSRLLGSAGEEDAPAVADTLVVEARSFFRVCSAVLISVGEGHAEISAMDPPGHAGRGPLPTGLPDVAALVGGLEGTELMSGERAARLARVLGLADEIRAALLLPMRVRETASYVLMLADTREELELDAGDLEVARGFAAAASAGLAQLQQASDSAEQSARHAALARAARTLNESLDLKRVLDQICEEAASILDADYANVFLGSSDEGLRFEATFGLPDEVIGRRIPTGEGLVGKVVEQERPLLTNDYQALARPISLPHFSRVRSSIAVPMHWDGELRGVLAVGYFTAHQVTEDHQALLEAFGELAAVACRNASAHAGLKLAARTDALTGCLNHAALHDTLRRELERCRRAGTNLSLSILDLDDFKQVNERHGHLAGDEVLRHVGQALRKSVRAYDLVARYGGDEFAIVTLDADEEEAAEVATRAIDGIRDALRRLDYPEDAGGATAGVAQSTSVEGPTSLIARADEALLHGKQQGRRGVAVRASELSPD